MSSGKTVVTTKITAGECPDLLHATFVTGGNGQFSIERLIDLIEHREKGRKWT